MYNQILIKQTATPGKIPATADIALGELAVNTNDGILFFKKENLGVQSVLSIDPATFNPVTSVNGSIGDVVITPASINALNLNQIGVANGIPSLDTDGLIPRAQLPALQINLSAAKKVPALSGTTIIPYDVTTPVITEGTQIASQAYIPSDPASKMCINGVINIDCSTSNRNFIIAVFRDSTCIGAAVRNFVTAGRPSNFPFSITDLDMGASFNTTINYSVRIGLTASGTWYVNRSNNAYLNGMLASNSIVFSEFL